MTVILPGTTSNDTKGALAVVGLLSDDNKFKKRLEELIKAAQTTKQMLDDAREADKSAKLEREKAEVMLADAKSKLAEAESIRAVFSTREQSLVAREKGLVTLEQNLKAKADAAFAARESYILGTERSLIEQSRQLEIKTEEAIKREDLLNMAIKDHNDKCHKREVILHQKEQSNFDMEKTISALRAELEAKVTAVTAALERLK